MKQQTNWRKIWVESLKYDLVRTNRIVSIRWAWNLDIIITKPLRGMYDRRVSTQIDWCRTSIHIKCRMLIYIVIWYIALIDWFPIWLCWLPIYLCGVMDNFRLKSDIQLIWYPVGSDLRLKLIFAICLLNPQH